VFKVANFLEEFLLRYKVDTKDADKKLENFSKQLKNIAATAKGDVSGAAMSMGKAFLGAAGTVAIAGAAIVLTLAAVYKAVKVCVEAMKDYNEQAIIARRTGLGPLQQEAVAINMSGASKGAVNRNEARKTQNTIAEYVRSAFTDPSGMNSQNVRLRMMGISAQDKNGDIKDTGKIMDELGKHWKGMTEEAARAEGDLLGISAQATDAIRQLGGAVSDTSGITLEMAQRQDAAASAAKDLNEAVNGMEDDFGDLGKYISDTLMPYVSAFMKILQDLVHNVIGPIVRDGFVKGIGHIGEAMWDNLKARVTGKDPNKTMAQSLEDTEGKRTEEEEKKRQDILKKQSENAKTNLNASAKLEKTANQFSAAVSAMPGSVDMQAAIAAWAGMAGRGQSAANDSGGSGKGGSGGMSANASQVTQMLMVKGWTADQAKGIAANLEMESSFNTSAEGDKVNGKFTAYGIAQWHADRQRKFKEIMGKDIRGSSLEDQVSFVDWELRNSHRAAGNKLKNARGAGASAEIVSRGYEIPARADWDAARRAKLAESYVGRNAIESRGGTSENDLNLDTFAGTLGMDKGQLMRGEGRRGDVEYMVKKRRHDIAMSIESLQAKIKDAEARGDTGTGGVGMLRQQLFRMQGDWMAVDKFGQSMIDRQKDKRGQDTTRFMPQVPTVNVTINGANDPHAIVKILTEEVQKAHNEHTSKFMT
jgi:Phage tail lysozyme